MKLETHTLNNPSEVILNIETLCRVTGGKSNPMQGRVTKRYDVVAELSMKDLYLKKMREDDPDFVVGQRKWGTRVGTGCMIEHKGKQYMECFIKEFRSGILYYLDGVPINRKDITGFPPPRENNTRIACYSVDSIKRMRLHHTSPLLSANRFVTLVKRLLNWK